MSNLFYSVNPFRTYTQSAIKVTDSYWYIKFTNLYYEDLESGLESSQLKIPNSGCLIADAGFLDFYQKNKTTVIDYYFMIIKNSLENSCKWTNKSIFKLHIVISQNSNPFWKIFALSFRFLPSTFKTKSEMNFCMKIRSGIDRI